MNCQRAFVILFILCFATFVYGQMDPVMARMPVNIPGTGHTVPHHADDEKKIAFKSQTVLVELPVLVTDKSGAHVHGLTKDDFKVFENGKEQNIGSFEEVVAASTRMSKVEGPENQLSNFIQDPQKPRAITIFAIDCINTPFLDQAYGRREIIKFLSANVDAGQSIALVALGGSGMKVLSGLTTDPAVLIKALKKYSGEIPAMNGIGQDARATAVTSLGSYNTLPGGTISGDIFSRADPEASIQSFLDQGSVIEAAYTQAAAINTTFRSFLDLAHAVAGIPGRKSLIWATAGFPFFMDSSAAVPGGDLSLIYEEAMAAMNDAQLSVYPVDVRGLVNYLPVTDTGTDHRIGYLQQQQTANRSWAQESTISVLQNFAEMTGGRAFYNRNDLTTGFKRAADDASTYYLVGYYLDTHNTRPGWRKLQVKVPQKDVQVRTRSGILVTNATMNEDRKLSLDFAVTSPFDSTEIPVTVQWRLSPADAGKKKVEVAFSVPANGVIIDVSQNNHFDIDFFTQATQGGKVSGNFGQTAKGNLPEAMLAQIKSEGMRYHSAMELAPGEYDFRFVVRDNLSGRIGTVSAPVTVN